jgi:hypothetical protein
MSVDQYSRQSFLGKHAEALICTCVVGVVGLGGGGSHITQQLAHTGFLHYVLYDSDVVEELNLNRLIGATKADAAAKTPKIEVARRMILGLQPEASIEAYQSRWQDHSYPLRGCDVIFGCVDGLAERRELEACARRYLIPYIDIGIDVHQVGTESPVMAGQVILSMPGRPCLTCLGLLTEDELSKETAQYGSAGPRPQVVWANGVLASTAVGVAVDLLTDWTRGLRHPVYLCYYGNQAILQPHIRLEYFGTDVCLHYPPGQVGDPLFKAL